MLRMYGESAGVAPVKRNQRKSSATALRTRQRIWSKGIRTNVRPTKVRHQEQGRSVRARALRARALRVRSGSQSEVSTGMNRTQGVCDKAGSVGSAGGGRLNARRVSSHRVSVCRSPSRSVLGMCALCEHTTSPSSSDRGVWYRASCSCQMHDETPDMTATATVIVTVTVIITINVIVTATVVSTVIVTVTVVSTTVSATVSATVSLKEVTHAGRVGEAVDGHAV